ncbi:MAG TPA: DUF1080 domain-containing protein [Pirellulales bacterium]|nr:DUF1080 domain-containing protein [Pirellulales bacterium]
MRRYAIMHVALIVTCISAPLMGAEPRAYVSLFDGRSLDGWNGNHDVFHVVDGAIVGGTLEGRNPRNEFLCTNRDYSDFELRVKFKLVGEGANAGVQFRSRRIPNHHEMIGYQADLGDKTWWGCLYDESRRKKVLAQADAEAVDKVLKRGEWNQYVIRARGRRIQLWINDLQTVDYTEPDESIEQTGLIGLQIHAGPPSQAWYKDIEITELTGE